jgi:hypothetical protein
MYNEIYFGIFINVLLKPNMFIQNSYQRSPSICHCRSFIPTRQSQRSPIPTSPALSPSPFLSFLRLGHAPLTLSWGRRALMAGVDWGLFGLKPQTRMGLTPALILIHHPIANWYNHFLFFFYFFLSFTITKSICETVILVGRRFISGTFCPNCFCISYVCPCCSFNHNLLGL